MNKPVALDLCCGRGGWTKGLLASGWDVVGVDIEHNSSYPKEAKFIQADITRMETVLLALPPIDLVVASPPCDEFSRHCMPWTRARNPPEPSLELIKSCEAIAMRLGAPMILENVRTAQRWLGKSKANCGPFHLWGAVPAIVPAFNGRPKESYSSTERDKRAEIPFALSRWIGECFLPVRRTHG